MPGRLTAFPENKVQFSSIAQSCPTFCDHMDCSMSGFPVHHKFQSLVKVMSIESVCVKLLSRVRLFVTPWTVAYQLPPSLGFSRQEYWSGLPFPSPGDLPIPGIEPRLLHCRQTLYPLRHQGSPRPPALQADALPSEPPGKPQHR